MKRQANGKFEFTSTGQAFIDVTDSTANVHYITNVVQKRWGADFQLVTADGLQAGGHLWNTRYRSSFDVFTCDYKLMIHFTSCTPKV